MPNHKFSSAVFVLPILAAFLIVAGRSASAQQERVLHSFDNNGRGGYLPDSRLILDAAGNLYGTAREGGFFGGGTVFELTPKTGGGWISKTLHNFSGSGTDGNTPIASLVFDAAGNLYGTTLVGGVNGWGTVFELSPTTGGAWTETVLHSFGADNSSDGQNPDSALLLHASGSNAASLYGTTEQGGTNNLGTVFQLSPSADGGWTETVLHSFGSGTDGQLPSGGVIADSAGNLYGTTGEGGTYGDGTVFKLTPAGEETVLHSFKPGNHDGVQPFGGLVMDPAGNLYGTTTGGGFLDHGIVFEVNPSTTNEEILHNFHGTPIDGEAPDSELIFDSLGNLYGTTSIGGASNVGTVFGMTPTANGWLEKVLHSFGDGKDGAYPNAGLIMDAAGNLYGTTYDGGTHNNGTVFAILH